MASKSAWVRVGSPGSGAGTGAAARWCSRCCRAATATLGVAEVDLDTGVLGEPDVLGHLVALVPGQGPGQRRGQGGDLRGQRVGDQVGFVAVGSATSITNRVERSTSVATGLIRLPKTRSPSQCPGTARSAASAGRSEMLRIPGRPPDHPGAGSRLGVGSPARSADER